MTLITWLRRGLYHARNKLLSILGRPPAPGGKDIDLLEELIRLQRSQDKPIFLCPQILIWNRTPTSMRRSFWDTVFGEREYPGTLRELYLFFRDRRQSQVRGGAPINLLMLLEEMRDLDAPAAAIRVREMLDTRLDREYRAVTGPRQRPSEEIKALVLEAPAIRDILKEIASKESKTEEEIRRRAETILDRMAADFQLHVARWLDWILNLTWRRIYNGDIDTDPHEIEALHKAAVKGPLLLLPSHKSHVDYLVLSQIFFRNDLMLPHIAAGDNLIIPVIGWIFRKSGAFFLRRSFGEDHLYRAIFREYVHRVLAEGNNLEFFVEGGRSRTGKLRPPKMGMLSIVVEGLLENKVPDIQIAPTSIGYDKIIEGESYSSELLGAKKQKESISSLLRARRFLKVKFGRVNVRFSKPFSMREYIQEQIQEEHRKGRTSYDPYRHEADKKHLIRSLAYRVIHDINDVSLITPTALVATVMMTHDRRGMSREELIHHYQWLHSEIEKRGGRLHSHPGDCGPVVDTAVDFLSKLLKSPRGLLEMTIRARESRMIELSYYRNQIMHLFLSEGVIACALQAFDCARASDPGAPFSDLLDHVRSVSQLLKLEFAYRPTAGIEETFEHTLEAMIASAVLQRDGEMIRITPQGGRMIFFLRSLFAPFLDSYFVASAALLGLSEGRSLDEKSLLKSMQSIAETLFHQGHLRHSDSVSSETLTNALDLFLDLKMLTLAIPDPKIKRPPRVFRLAEGWTASQIESFLQRTGLYTSCRRSAPQILPRLHALLAPSPSQPPKPTPAGEG